MIKDLDFETYLIVSSDKLRFIYTILKIKIIYV